jgi:hypothetical protein
MGLTRDDDVVQALTSDGADHSLGEAVQPGSALPFGHVLCDGGLSDLEAELKKLTMDARRAPERVIVAHLVD